MDNNIFIKLGNLPHLSARKIKQEIQVISTTGGDPNPLAGYFSVTLVGIRRQIYLTIFPSPA